MEHTTNGYFESFHKFIQKNLVRLNWHAFRKQRSLLQSPFACRAGIFLTMRQREWNN